MIELIGHYLIFDFTFLFGYKIVFLNDRNDLVCGLLFYENKWYAVELKAIFKYLSKSGPIHFIALSLRLVYFFFLKLFWLISTFPAILGGRVEMDCKLVVWLTQYKSTVTISR